MTKPRLILDQDDVLANTHGKLAQIVLKDFGTALTHEILHQGPFQEVLSPTDQKKLYKLIHQPGFFTDIAVIEGAQAAVLELSKKYEIFVATAAMEFPNSFREKYDWLKQHFDFIPWSNIVFCGDKSILSGDYLIDDMPRNLKTFKGTGLLFNAPHNLQETAYERVMNWEEIITRLL
ncbi:MAG: 5'(3')-deoxyribonucleotidase [Spirosomataceae bacterium]